MFDLRYPQFRRPMAFMPLGDDGVAIIDSEKGNIIDVRYRFSTIYYYTVYQKLGKQRLRDRLK